MFHQLVVLVIFTNTSNDSGCHWASSLYNFEKDETHGLHSTDCNFSHCSGGGRWRATGWSPPAVDVSEPFGAWGRTPLHWAALYGHTAVVEQLLAAGAAVDAADDNEGHGLRKRPVGTTGGGVEGWSDAEWVKEQLGDKLLDDCQCAMYTELWQDWCQLGGIRIFWIFSYAMVSYFGKWQYMRWQSDRTQWHPLVSLGCPITAGI